MKALLLGTALFTAGSAVTIMPSAAAAQAEVATQRSGMFSVKLDRVSRDAQGWIDAILLMRNETAEAQQITDGTFSVVLLDVDGLGVAVTEVHDGDQAELRRYTTFPMIAPGAEVRLRYRIRTLTNGAPITQLIVREPDKGQATFDVAHLAGAASVSPIAGPVGTGAFVPLGIFAVRKDALRLVNGRLELFFTLRNTGKQPQQVSGEFEFLLGNARVANRREFAPARGTWATAHDTLWVEPGAEARLRTWFEARSPGTVQVTDWTRTELLP